MNHILFVVEVPDIKHLSGYPPSDEAKNWHKFLQGAKNISGSYSVKTKTSPNVWLIEAKNGLPFLSDISSLASELQLSYSAFLIPSEIINMGGETFKHE